MSILFILQDCPKKGIYKYLFTKTSLPKSFFILFLPLRPAGKSKAYFQKSKAYFLKSKAYFF